MANKKNFNTDATMGKFFTQEQSKVEEQPIQEKAPEKAIEEPKKPGRPLKEEKLRGYRYNLNLDKDLKPFLQKIAWENRTSITQYMNDLIRAEQEKYLAEGGSLEGWELDE